MAGRRWPAVEDIVPAARTVLVVHDGSLDTDLLDVPADGAVPAPGPLVTVDVTYDGEDLPSVAAATGRSVEDVIALHSGADYTVAFCGFMPGFAYMTGLPEVLHLPRRATPRERVPAGAVAIAAEYAGVYPREPGRLAPAGADRRRAVGRRARAARPPAARHTGQVPAPVIEVRSWGIAGSVVDAGRPGRAWLGAARGRVDLASLRLVNRVVGNGPDAPALESSGGLSLRCSLPPWSPWLAPSPTWRSAAGRRWGGGTPCSCPPAPRVRIGRLLDGARVYVGVRGGVGGDTPPVGDPLVHAVPRPPLHAVVGIWPGPRLDWFAPDTWTVLDRAEFVVTSTSRVGARLRPGTGPAACRRASSEGMVEGAVQVPPDGNPIVMLADHPATGGYPVIAVVDVADIPALAQAAPGTSLRLRVLAPTPE
ncbi:MAG: carboxyltransferase domain-containing protein [Ilumatobacteraceae bacterium]